MRRNGPGWRTEGEERTGRDRATAAALQLWSETEGNATENRYTSSKPSSHEP